LKLFAVSDTHFRSPGNRAFLEGLPERPEDWLILGGDVCERLDDLAVVLDTLAPKFQKILWTPGNHELWTVPHDGPRGVDRYEQLVRVCRERGVLTPEDPYPLWPGGGPKTYVAPLFLLYDYSFRPDDVTRERAIEWAMEHELLCADEKLLHFEPHSSRDEWCNERCATTEARLAALDADAQTVLINHFPLRRAHATLPMIPRFSIWCGTRKTEDWPTRFRARVVVYGHLHIRRTHVENGVRFEEVSLGYSGQWAGDPMRYLRIILD
jgi:3',5'-cyclic AMP phosphodiesterase CpdA